MSINSSQLRWPQNYFEILQGFWSDIFLKIKRPWNSYEILQGLGSESWKLVLESNNSDDYHILRELDDHGILVKFQRNFDQNSFQSLNDYGILQGFWSLLFSRIRWPMDFNQTSDDHRNPKFFRILVASLNIQNSGIFLKFEKNFD